MIDRSSFNDYRKYISSNKKIPQSVLTTYNLGAFSGDHFFNEIGMKMLEHRIIFLTGEIDLYSSELIKSQMMYLDSISNEDIKMYINSPGGSVYDGLSILDVMDNVSCDVSTINTGLAASMAAVILCYGKIGKRKSLKRSRTMIHQPLSYIGMAQASDIEIDSRQLSLLKKEIYEIMSNQTGQSYDKVHSDADRDYWMTALDAKKYGIIDEILNKK